MDEKYTFLNLFVITIICITGGFNYERSNLT
jgi:hypothetical protein